MEEKKDGMDLVENMESQEPRELGSCSKEYLFLFNGITDILRELENVKSRLSFLQLCAEEMYIIGEEIKPYDVEQEPSVTVEKTEVAVEKVVVEQ